MALIFDLFDPIFDLNVVLLEQIGLVEWASRIVLSDQNICCGSFVPDRSYQMIGMQIADLISRALKSDLI